MKKYFVLLTVFAISLFQNQAIAETYSFSESKSPSFLDEEKSDCFQKKDFPIIYDQDGESRFPLCEATIFFDPQDFKVVEIAGGMFSDDIIRVTGKAIEKLPTSDFHAVKGPAIIIGTIGQSALINELINNGLLQVDEIEGKWESFIITTIDSPSGPILAIAGSDRRGTAFGLTSLSRAIGVSPWYWWADVEPLHKDALFIEQGRYVQGEPSVQYRGIFINDERFGGWARWVENNFDKESGEVGPKVYKMVFELLLRLKGNYLWPAMHNGTKAFNANPENAKLADDYGIVMGSSHCEQMLRNNEDEWKNVGIYGDFNYLTNRDTMLDYWESRIKTNGKYENTYTLGLRGIHDYPMEGASTTQERTGLMQKAIDDQREILSRNIDRPLEQIPQVLCTYEEVLESYHNGLEVPEDVTLLWCDDKHGYTRNLCNPDERRRSGGSGIYYHLSYHGDPASWIWLSPLSPSFICNELTKAYVHGVKKIWIFNVGDIKPAEKELTFVMDLGWDIGSWIPTTANGYIKRWVEETFGKEFSDEIAAIQDEYYRLQASGKDSHVYFVEYPEDEIDNRLERFHAIAQRADALSSDIPDQLKDAYFELVSYPVKGTSMLNEYQLLSRRSLARMAVGDSTAALIDAERAKSAYDSLNLWTDRYNKEIKDGKWNYFFNWVPYHWYYADGMAAPMASIEKLNNAGSSPTSCFVPVSDATSASGANIVSDRDCEMQLWIRAISPINNFSKSRENNIFCRVTIDNNDFEAAATPINNIWHASSIGPMWSNVGSIELKKGSNMLKITDIKQGARVDSIFLGIYPPFPDSPFQTVKARDLIASGNSKEGEVTLINGLGFTDGLEVLPFDTPSYNLDSDEDIPYADFSIKLKPGINEIEIRTLPSLHIYEGRDARFGVKVGDHDAEVFSIHTDDFSAEWRRNVLKGYASRTVTADGGAGGQTTIRFYFLDPGIVLQEIRVK